MTINLKHRFQPQAIAMIGLAIVVTFLVVPLFIRLIFGSYIQPELIKSDYSGHIELIQSALQTGIWPSYPMFHVLVYLVALGSAEAWTLANASVVVVTFFVVLKGLINYLVLKKDFPSVTTSLLISLALLFVMPLFNYWGFRLYLGQIAPNLWHNPTTIVAMPMAILLFYKALESLESTKLRDYLILGGLVVLNLLSKPNYLLAFLPVYFIVQFLNYLKHRNRTVLIGLALIAAIAVSVLLIQFSLTFGQTETESSKIVFSFMSVWSAYSRNVVVSLLVSIAFPLAYAVAYRHEIMSDKKMLMAWMIFIVALAQYSFLAEQGPRFLHGNFGWASITSVYILYLVTATRFFSMAKTRRINYVTMAFTLHVLTGILYYFKILLGYGFL